MKVIEIQELKKVYESNGLRVEALDGVNLSFDTGEFAAVVGPSGSGKTTLLNILGGLDKATEGNVRIDGIDIGNLSDRKLVDFRMRNIGFVFQAYNLIPVLTASENIEFIMQLQGMPKEERASRVEQLLSAIGIPERGRSRPKQLSGGQQQRVAVARALASKPRFILADEPTANLDSAAATNLLQIMETLNLEENITFIFSTHDQRVVERARRIITLQDGKVVSDVCR